MRIQIRTPLTVELAFATFNYYRIADNLGLNPDGQDKTQGIALKVASGRAVPLARLAKLDTRCDRVASY
jgi:hypothetical protein